MSMLIDRLKREHAAMVETLNKIKEVGIGSKEGQDKLRSAKIGLLAHLKAEDAQLYPTLNQAAKNDESLRRTVEMFARDMENVSREAMNFFEKYARGGSGLEFAKDFGRLYTLLAQRISKEEKSLYPAYDSLSR
jgi:hemerythrin-like domain-containing protein